MPKPIRRPALGLLAGLDPNLIAALAVLIGGAGRRQT